MSDVQSQILSFREFFEQYHEADLLEQIRVGKNFLVVDFKNLSRFDSELADVILDQPEEAIAAAVEAIKEIDSSVSSFNIRFKNLPPSNKVMISEIRSKHIRKFLWTEGVIRQKSDVRPQVTKARFECPACAQVITVLQLDNKLREPNRCSCGRKGQFMNLSHELIDGQGLILEEAAEDLEGSDQPKRMRVFLKDDLVSPITDRKTGPGSKIRLAGWVTEVPITLKSGGKSNKMDLIINGNFIEPVQEDLTDVKISSEEEEKILKLASDKEVYKKIINSMAPSIFGHQNVKEALLLQMVSGVQKERSDGVVSRGDMHVLLIGDPGSGKSQLLKRMTKIAPKARYVTGKGVSGAGLTAAVVKDEFLGGWSLEAGALVLNNRGFVMIDELDKMSKEDRSAMHEALEQQTVSISKANIQATLRAETTVLAAANPKFGRFDYSEAPVKQINLPPTLINRFDLIFPIKDIPNKESDEQLAQHVLTLHRNPDTFKGELDTDFLKKYIAYARKNIKPVLTDDALNEIKEYYVRMRNYDASDEIKSVPITARQLEALTRMSEASAKIRLASEVTVKDAQRAIRLLEYCLQQVAVDTSTGKIDIDILGSGASASQRNKITIVKDILIHLESVHGKSVPMEEIVESGSELGLSRDQVDEVIDKLKRSGDLFEPKRGFVQKI